MPLELRQANSTEDVSKLAKVHLDAFNLIRVNQAIWPHGITTAIISGAESRHRKSLEGDPTAHYLTIVDTDRDDEIIAFADWHIFNTAEEEATRTDLAPREWGRDVDVDVATEFWAHIVEARRKMQGKAHCFLAVIATDPAHHRRGAAAILMQWGIDQADARGLPCFLESSPYGEGLYKKFGFEEVSHFTVNIGKTKNSPEMYKHLVMIRPAKEHLI